MADPLAQRRFVVAREDDGSRVDRFLVRAFAGDADARSRTELARWVEAERVLVDGKRARPGDHLRAGAKVDVRPLGPRATTAEPDASVEFRVVYVDDALVVVDKPAGLVVHPARGHEGGTLVNGLLARGLFDRPSELADPLDAKGHLRPGIVHRLDGGTSGLLVVARTAAAREALKAQFQVHRIDREYIAIVQGEAREATHDTLHGRDPRNRLRFTTHVADGRRAVTHVRVLEHFASLATLVACTLETGRTHQIRVHLAESGTPVLGDPLYGKAPTESRLRAIGAALGHQALHARVLGFVHPTTRVHVRFEAEAPADFARAVEELRAVATRGRGGETREARGDRRRFTGRAGERER